MITGAHCRGTSPWVRPNYGLSLFDRGGVHPRRVASPFRQLGGAAWPNRSAEPRGGWAAQAVFLYLEPVEMIGAMYDQGRR
jgi:hypothetical protein